MLSSALLCSIKPLTVAHAAAAARLHIAGQPNTFLTSLGPAVLTTFYRALPQSPTGFGFTALAPAADQAPPVIGFVSATTSTGQLFLELGTRHLPAFLPPLLRRFAQRPGLLLHCIQTVFYPLLQHSSQAQPAAHGAELLSIMVEPAWRSQGVGGQLVTHLFESCQARQIDALDVTVAAENRGAQEFYRRHGFRFQQEFQLYGRPMQRYRLAVGSSIHS
ncbi:MAG: GNAT family N-acetyltransferase [Caldilineaceae bacterium]|nr:GNAT family N-acetyltransferase [Caldilineaceae bacterium]